MFLFFWGLLWLSVVGLTPVSKDEEEETYEPAESPVEATPAVKQTDDSTLNPDDVRVLQLLASGFREYRTDEIASELRMPPQRAQHHVDRLMNTENATQSYDEYLNPIFEITAAGRATLVKLGLL